MYEGVENPVFILSFYFNHTQKTINACHYQIIDLELKLNNLIRT